MKTFSVILALAALAVCRAPAQVVTVQLSLDQDQFLPSETLPVTVRVVNNSGQTLHLGADPDWLQFGVQSADNDSVVMENGAPPVVGPFVLESSHVATKRVDIAPYFSLNHAGRYVVTATVHIKEWNKDVTSPAKEFDVIDGARLWSQAFGVPIAGGASNRPPEVRKYILEEANYLRSQLRLYVLVSDATESHIFKVLAIGPMVSFSQPEAQLDRQSRLHVLYQSGAQSFIYAIVGPDGGLVQKEIYDYLNTRPRLGVSETGDIVVIGGVRRVKPSELPTVKAPHELPPPSR
jgi:hypothetical protein